MNKLKKNQIRRKLRSRYKLTSNNKQRFNRVYFHVTNKNLYAQLIETQTGKTLITISTLDSTFQKDRSKKNLSNKDGAENLANLFVGKITKFVKKDEQLVFDRGSKLHHGKVKHFVETLKEKGIKI